VSGLSKGRGLPGACRAGPGSQARPTDPTRTKAAGEQWEIMGTEKKSWAVGRWVAEALGGLKWSPGLCRLWRSQGVCRDGEACQCPQGPGNLPVCGDASTILLKFLGTVSPDETYLFYILKSFPKHFQVCTHDPKFC